MEYHLTKTGFEGKIKFHISSLTTLLSALTATNALRSSRYRIELCYKIAKPRSRSA